MKSEMKRKKTSVPRGTTSHQTLVGAVPGEDSAPQIQRFIRCITPGLALAMATVQIDQRGWVDSWIDGQIDGISLNRDT